MNYMKCTDCEHFNILYDPYRSGGILWDTGRAECTKYNLVIDTVSKQQINKLVCVEASTEGEAIELPPHGYLGDLSELSMTLYSELETQTPKTLGEVMKIIKKVFDEAPTVLEAST